MRRQLVDERRRRQDRVLGRQVERMMLLLLLLMMLLLDDRLLLLLLLMVVVQLLGDRVAAAAVATVAHVIEMLRVMDRRAVAVRRRRDAGAPLAVMGGHRCSVRANRGRRSGGAVHRARRLLRVGRARIAGTARSTFSGRANGRTGADREKKRPRNIDSLSAKGHLTCSTATSENVPVLSDTLEKAHTFSDVQTSSKGTHLETERNATNAKRNTMEKNKSTTQQKRTKNREEVRRYYRVIQ